MKDISERYEFTLENGHKFTSDNDTILLLIPDLLKANKNKCHAYANVLNMYDDILPFSEGLAVVTMCNSDDYYDPKSRVKGFINKQGNEVVRCNYSYPNSFSEGLSVTGKITDPTRKYVIDRLGQVHKFRYHILSDFSEGLAIVKKSGKYGYIDKYGKIAISCVFDNAYPFNSERALVLKNGKYSFIDTNGNVVIPNVSQNAHNFSDGVAWIAKKDAHILIDALGQELFSCDYEMVFNYSEDLAKVYDQNKRAYGYIDKMGEEVIPCIFEETSLFSEGLASARKKHAQLGYIDKEGHFVIKQKYSSASPFRDGLAKVRENGKLHFINQSGKKVEIFNEAFFKQTYKKIKEYTWLANSSVAFAYNLCTGEIYAVNSWEKIVVLKSTDGSLTELSSDDIKKLKLYLEK